MLNIPWTVYPPRQTFEPSQLNKKLKLTISYRLLCSVNCGSHGALWPNHLLCRYLRSFRPLSIPLFRLCACQSGFGCLFLSILGFHLDLLKQKLRNWTANSTRFCTRYQWTALECSHVVLGLSPVVLALNVAFFTAPAETLLVHEEMGRGGHDEVLREPGLIK